MKSLSQPSLVSRRALSLLEVLIAALLMGGLLAILLRAWIGIESQSQTHTQEWIQRSNREMAHVWLVDHLSSLIERPESACLEVQGEQILVNCFHGSHTNPRLAGPVQLRLWCAQGALQAEICSDPFLWEGEPARESWSLLPGVVGVTIRAFGQLGDDSSIRWHEGPQAWRTAPLFCELVLICPDAEERLPIFVMREG